MDRPQRQHSRTKANLPVRVRYYPIDHPDQTEAEVEGLMVDASFRGCQLALAPLEEGLAARLMTGELFVSVTTMVDGQSLTVTGRFRWSNAMGSGVRVGVEYLEKIPQQVTLVEELHRADGPDRTTPHPAWWLGAGLCVGLFAMWLVSGPAGVNRREAVPSTSTVIAPKARDSVHTTAAAPGSVPTNQANPTQPLPVESTAQVTLRPAVKPELHVIDVSYDKQSMLVTARFRSIENQPSGIFVRLKVRDMRGELVDMCSKVIELETSNRREMEFVCEPQGSFALPLTLEWELN